MHTTIRCSSSIPVDGQIGNVPETATRTVSVTDTKIPYLEMLNITSDNANNTRATINDILTITLETNETLAGANITALNGTFQMITENDTATVNIPVTVRIIPLAM